MFNTLMSIFDIIVLKNSYVEQFFLKIFFYQLYFPNFQDQKNVKKKKLGLLVKKLVWKIFRHRYNIYCDILYSY